MKSKLPFRVEGLGLRDITPTTENQMDKQKVKLHGKWSLQVSVGFRLFITLNPEPYL